MMNRYSFFVLICIFMFFYFLNILHPLSFGDDYLYAFIWQGQPMHVPLPDNAGKVSSWQDLLASQQLLYYTWGGRIVGQTLTQLFMWLDKGIFNIFNSLIATLLVIEIYWCANKGNIELCFNWQRVCWIFFALWAFTPGFNPVFLWLTGSCIYLWTSFLLLLFLLPYIKKYYAFHEKVGTNYLFSIVMFLLGLISGFGNENCICWIILTLSLFLFAYRKCRGKEIWMYSGFVGFLLGYALLIFAPGNTARLYAQHGTDWISIKMLKDNFYIFAVVLTFQLFLWHFNFKSLCKLSKAGLKNRIVQKDILLVKVICIISFGMSAIMLLSPFFPPRSGFPGTVQLIIASSVLLRLQKDNGTELISKAARKFLYRAGILYFVMSVLITVQYSYESDIQMTAMINSAKQMQKISDDTILTVKPFKDSGALKDLLSGYHLSYFDLSEDVNDWGNVAFSRYYGIKGVRMIK